MGFAHKYLPRLGRPLQEGYLWALRINTPPDGVAPCRRGINPGINLGINPGINPGNNLFIWQSPRANYAPFLNKICGMQT
jgi:hypothetical protein